MIENKWFLQWYPDSFEPYAPELLKYALEYIRLEPTALPSGESLPLTASKYSGNPYLPVGATYPMDKNGVPMVLLAQINFSEVPTEKDYPELLDFPSHGIFQFFSSVNWKKTDDYKTVYYETIGEPQKDFSFLNPELLGQSPIECEHSLAISLGHDPGSLEDFRFNYSFDGKNLNEFIEELEEEDEEEEVEEIEDFLNNEGHRMGGYGHFIQFDPRKDKKELQNHVLLLQIDCAPQIQFGFNGIVHLFIDRDDLRAKRFDKTYFHWEIA
ncbi:MAG TPA: YwqG family protein [Flavobacterium sp.]|nr:YwqG family protein [Flavobacterium sp.]